MFIESRTFSLNLKRDSVWIQVRILIIEYALNLLFYDLMTVDNCRAFMCGQYTAYRLVLQRRRWVMKHVVNGAVRVGGWVMDCSTISDHSCRSKTVLLTGFTAGSLRRWAVVKRWPPSTDERIVTDGACRHAIA